MRDFRHAITADMIGPTCSSNSPDSIKVNCSVSDNVIMIIITIMIIIVIIKIR